MEKGMDRYIGQCLSDRYEVLEAIGKGGMAVVYKALDHRLNRCVAVKLLRDDMAVDDEFRARFQAESQAVAMLSHPNIVSVYDVGQSGDDEYIVMELIEGITLKQYMRTKGTLSWTEALHFSTQIARALSHAHSRAIIHRDIKPQNLMLLRDGTIKVADFGIAFLENGQEPISQQQVGSVHYISPEQARGIAVDVRSDIYSLGIVMYEMLTGELPYEGDTAESVALQHIAGAAMPPRSRNPEIPEELERITLKAMSADINGRYQSTAELLSDLEEFRKSTAAVISGEGFEDGIAVRRDIAPIGRAGELSKEDYERRRLRSRKVSVLSGLFCVLVFLLAITIFLWNFWLKDLFSTPVRTDVPNWVGEQYEDVISNKELLKSYNFTVVYSLDPNTKEGEIIAQDPAAGRSMMIVPEGIDITLTVSTGVMMTEVPNVVNKDYREATTELEKAGFVVERLQETSPDVTKNYVISMNPSAGELLPAGSTVYITVSIGPEVAKVTVPNLIGLTQSYAASRLDSLGLTLGGISFVANDSDAGLVVWQSVPAHTEVEAHTKVYLQVSTGPEEEEEPEEGDGAGDGEGTDTGTGETGTPGGDTGGTGGETGGEAVG